MLISKVLNFLKRILSLLIFVAMLIAGDFGLSYILEPLSYAHFFVPDIEHIEKSGEDIELVIVGGSRIFRSFDPEVLEEDLGFGVINGASALQSFSGSYYQLKDLIERFSPKYAVLGVAWNGLTYGIGTQSNLIVLDRLTGLHKVEFMKEGFSDEERLYAVLKPYRFRKNLEREIISEIVEEKRAAAKCRSEGVPYIKDDEYYAGKGFVYSKLSMAQGNIAVRWRGAFEADKVHADRLEYFEKIVKLCRENGVKLMLVSAPTSMMHLFNTDNYQGAVEYYEDFARKNGLVYRNLNYLKGRDELLPDTALMDHNHLNGEGARILSEVYAEILKKDITGESVEEYFYKDLEEMQASVKRVVAIKAWITRSETEAEGEYTEFEIILSALRHEDIWPFYQIIYESPEGETEVLVDWIKKTDFNLTLPTTAGSSIIIRAGTSPRDEEPAWQRIEYNDIGTED